MKIKYEDIDEQEIVNLIAWFAKKKGKDITIHTPEGIDVEITMRDTKKKSSSYDDDSYLFGAVAACCACL